MFKKWLKNKKGFTLVELMVVVGILGVLTAIAIPVYNNVATNAEATACAATRRSIESAYQMYRAAGNSDTTDISKLVPGYLAEAPKCPGGGTYTLNSNGTVTCSEHNSAASSSSSSSSR